MRKIFILTYLLLFPFTSMAKDLPGVFSLEKQAIIDRDERELMKNKDYIIDPDFLYRLFIEEQNNYQIKKEGLLRILHPQERKKELSLLRKGMVKSIFQKLDQQYPGVITVNPEWMHNFTGGAFFDIALGTCSLKEYILFDYSGTGTEGYTGSYGLEIYDFILDGKIVNYYPGELVSNTFHPGSYTYHARQMHNGFMATEDTLLFEYARGNMMDAIKVGILANYKNVLLEKEQVDRQLKACMKMVFKNVRARHKLVKKKTAMLKKGIADGWKFPNFNLNMQSPEHE